MNWYGYCGNNPVMFVDVNGYAGEPIMGLVFGQDSNQYVKDLKFYNSPISDVGCEIVAIHNVLVLLDGLGRDFKEVVEACKKISYIPGSGILGCKPKKIGEVLDDYSIQYSSTKDVKQLDNFVTNNNIYIMSFWNDSKLDGLHTVSFTCNSDGSITAFNTYNGQSSYYFYDSFSDFKASMMKKDSQFIIIYEIDEEVV